MAGQTNIVVDGSSETALVKALIDYVDKHLNGSPSDKLKKSFAKWLGDHDLSTCYLTVVKNQVSDDIENKLTKAGIEYMNMRTPMGMAFVVKEDDRDAFLRIQYDVLSMRPEFYAACTVEQALNRAKESHQQQMACIHTDSQAAAEELIARINQEGKGIVASICHDPSTPYNYDVLVNVDDAVKKNGADIVRLELQWALKQGDRDLSDFRSDQAAYDLNEMKIMLSELGKGRGVSIVDHLNGSNVRVDITPNGAVFKQRGQYGGWNETRRIPDDDDFVMPVFDPENENYDTTENKARLSQFEMALRAGMKDIRNMRVVPIAEAERYCNRSIEQVNAEIKAVNEKNLPYEYGENKDNSHMFVAELNPDRPARPDFGTNSAATAEQKKLYEWYKEKGEAVLDAVNEEAHRQAMMIPGFEYMSPAEKRNALVSLTEQVLKEKRLPAIREYLNSPEAPAGVDQFYDNLVSNFHDQSEADGLSVSFLSLEEIEWQKNRFKDYVVETKEAEETRKRKEAEAREHKKDEAEKTAAAIEDDYEQEKSQDN